MTVDGYVRFVPGCAVNACIVKPVCDFGAMKNMENDKNHSAELIR